MPRRSTSRHIGTGSKLTVRQPRASENKVYQPKLAPTSNTSPSLAWQQRQVAAWKVWVKWCSGSCGVSGSGQARVAHVPRDGERRFRDEIDEHLIHVGVVRVVGERKRRLRLRDERVHELARRRAPPVNLHRTSEAKRASARTHVGLVSQFAQPGSGPGPSAVPVRRARVRVAGLARTFGPAAFERGLELHPALGRHLGGEGTIRLQRWLRRRRWQGLEWLDRGREVAADPGLARRADGERIQRRALPEPQATASDNGE
eukprot:scaffold20335_cov63-Phaeocystis_antarctica.AAC.2